MSNELISIIIPTYNRYDLLLHCIQSCLSQTYQNIEIIVIDDCSTDPRYKNGELEKFPKTTVLHLPINQRQKYNVFAAQGMTRQEGINISKGEWIAFLDDDDFFLPNKLEFQLDYMKKHSALFSSTNMYRVHHRSIGNILDIEIQDTYFRNKSLPSIFNLDLIKHTNYINNSSVLLHKCMIHRVGLFEPIRYEDWEYWKRVLLYTPCYYIDEPLVYYTVSIDGSHQKNYIY
jgi:teichuronic acid biosynthesis glycosyltransferase TuaG